VRGRARHLQVLSVRDVNAWIGRALPFIVRRSLRRGLHGVWAKGGWAALPEGGVVLAANHHAWWDPYLVWLVGRKLGRPLSGLMLEATLARFPFFRVQGALARTEVREALRRLQRGHLLVVFPEGALSPPGRLKEVREGVAFLAERAEVPIYPLAVRVAMRGAQHPEAFLVLGKEISVGARSETLERTKEALNALLDELDGAIVSSPPEAPLPGFVLWSAGARSFHERVAWVGRLLR